MRHRTGAARGLVLALAAGLAACGAPATETIVTKSSMQDATTGSQETSVAGVAEMSPAAGTVPAEGPRPTPSFRTATLALG